ncbi:VWA domain-containing protein [candidate division KSB1 bacterium]|nr:VWA domain-containing protein [candidate division KSB1 bacterium]
MNGAKQLLLKPAVILACAIAMTSCDKKGTEPTDPNSDIPGDPTNVTVPAPAVNNLKPTATFETTAGNDSRIRINLLGLLDPTNNYQKIDFKANQNIFLTEDGAVQGFLVKPVSSNNVLSADVVFTVDNSGSMSEEADSVANSIAAFTSLLAASGLNVVFGCVGYDDFGRISGGIDLTTATSLRAYLNRTSFGFPLRGISRTKGFAGTDSLRLASEASGYASSVSGENGVVATLFADQKLSWRAGAQRVFINFTDEPTQPNSTVEWSTETLCQALAGKATVHTVWSGSDTASFFETRLVREKPWRMSTCSGGTIKVVPPSAAGLNLADLPVTGALANSSLLEFVSANPNASHTIVITVKASDRADGKTVYENVKYK